MEKKSRGKTIVIVILVLVVLGLGGYIVYDNNYKKVNNDDILKTNTTENQKEDLDVLAKGLAKFIDDNNIRYILSVKDQPNSLDFNKKMIDSDVIYSVIEGIGDCVLLETCNEIKTKELDNYFKRVFNVSGITYESYNCPIDNQPLLNFDKENDAYVLAQPGKSDEVWHGHGGIYFFKTPIYTKIDSLVKENNNYVLTMYELYNNIRDAECISADPQGKVKVFDYAKYQDDLAQGVNDSIIADYEIAFEQNKNNYPKFKYIFNKNNDGDFYLVKYELIN